jgi:serine carboxypeptidase-like clade 2
MRTNFCCLVQIGNAVLNDATDQMGMVEYAWSHAIISDELYSAVRRECDSFKEEEDGGKPSKGCSPAVRAFLRAYDDIDIYSIYTPTCLSSSSSSPASASPRRSSPGLVAAPRLFSKHVKVLPPPLAELKRHGFREKTRA